MCFANRRQQYELPRFVCLLLLPDTRGQADISAPGFRAHNGSRLLPNPASVGPLRGKTPESRAAYRVDLKSADRQDLQSSAMQERSWPSRSISNNQAGFRWPQKLSCTVEPAKGPL